MKLIVALMTVGPLLLLSDASWARREALTNDQKTQMERIDRVLIDVLALSDQGPVDARPLAEVVAGGPAPQAEQRHRHQQHQAEREAQQPLHPSSHAAIVARPAAAGNRLPG